MTGSSSLPLAQEDGHNDQHQKFRGVSKIIGPPWAHLPTITIGLLGVQIFWSVEMSYGERIHLGRSPLHSNTSSVTISVVIGPLKIEHGGRFRRWSTVRANHATINRSVDLDSTDKSAEPIAGVLADNCTSRFGRRRPYMMLGTIICIFAMLLLGFTRDVASIFTGWGTGAVSYYCVLPVNCHSNYNFTERRAHHMACCISHISNRFLHQRW